MYRYYYYYYITINLLQLKFLRNSWKGKVHVVWTLQKAQTSSRWVGTGATGDLLQSGLPEALYNHRTYILLVTWLRHFFFPSSFFISYLSHTRYCDSDYCHALARQSFPSSSLFNADSSASLLHHRYLLKRLLHGGRSKIAFVPACARHSYAGPRVFDAGSKCLSPEPSTNFFPFSNGIYLVTKSRISVVYMCPIQKGNFVKTFDWKFISLHNLSWTIDSGISLILLCPHQNFKQCKLADIL